jgi:hypothetical protein
MKIEKKMGGNLEAGLGDTGCEDVRWMGQAQDRVQWSVLVLVSQLVEAYARGERNKVWLAGYSKRCILSDRFCCVPVYGVPLNH